MLWDLPHRRRDADESTSLQLEAPTSAAIEAERAQSPTITFSSTSVGSTERAP